MGCVSSKIMAKSGSFQEKVSHSFQRSSLIEEIILSNSKSNGDQFVALLCTSGTAAKDAGKSPPAAEPARIETINVAELLAGLEEEGQEQEGGENGGGGRSSPADRAAASGGGADGRARSFRTVEEFDALVARSSSPEQEEAGRAAVGSDQKDAVAAATQGGGGGSAVQEEVAGSKRRARARQLSELKVASPSVFDFSKSVSLRDWLLRGGQIFSPGSYVTPKFGNVAAPPSAGEDQQQQAAAVFDPELVAQLEQAMEQLTADEESVLKEILEAGKKALPEPEMPDDQAMAVAAQN